MGVYNYPIGESVFKPFWLTPSTKLSQAKYTTSPNIINRLFFLGPPINGTRSKTKPSIQSTNPIIHLYIRLPLLSKRRRKILYIYIYIYKHFDISNLGGELEFTFFFLLIHIVYMSFFPHMRWCVLLSVLEKTCIFWLRPSTSSCNF